MNPVILRLIAIKWQLFGKFYTAKNTCLNLMYTILWTILGVTLPKGDKKYFYTPTGRNSWRIVLEILALGMAVYFIVKVTFTAWKEPVFGLNMEKYGVSLRIQSKCKKVRTRKTPNTNTFCAVFFSHLDTLAIFTSFCSYQECQQRVLNLCLFI